jgi:hypothetical protein
MEQEMMCIVMTNAISLRLLDGAFILDAEWVT